MPQRTALPVLQNQKTEAVNYLGGSRVPRLRRAALLAFVLFVLCLGMCFGWGKNDVFTQHNDNARSGLYANEKLLTPANVNSTRFGKLFTQNVDGIIVGQPLYASNVLMNDGHKHNVVYVATQHNTVYAFDADNVLGSNAAPLWSVSLNDGGTPDPIADYGCTGTHYTEIGITSTGVINPGKTTLYLVAKTVTGTGPNAVRNFSLHSLDITNGSERLGGPVIISGTAPSGNGSGTFNPIFQLQRPALLQQQGAIYIAFGGNGCDVFAYNGWLFAYNAQTLQQEAAFLVTPNGFRASIWQGGSGPAVDGAGNIYVTTANGTFDGPGAGNDYGDSVLKLGWNGNVLGVVDYFTPFNQNELSQDDLDLGSSGPLVLPDQPGLFPHELVAGGKQGTLYLIDRDNPGQFDSQVDNVIQSIPHAVVSELVGVPSYWNSSVYVAGDLDVIKQFALINGQLTPEPVSQTTSVFGGAGPSSTSISANGNSNGILWAIRHVNPALFAFDATNLANQFYTSTQALGFRDKLVPIVRFVTPTIANGKVYIGGSSALAVYGLLPVLSVRTGNNQTGVESTVLPIPLSLVVTDAYTSQPLAGVVVTCKPGSVGGELDPSPTQTTDATGTVTYTYQLPRKPTPVTINCSSRVSTTAVFHETSTTGPPAHMNIASGNKQTAPPNTPLAAPLKVKVGDAKGFGVAGVTVSFTDNAAGGAFTASSAITDANGNASTQYTTGPNTGTVKITASTAGVKSVIFTVTVQ